MKQYIGTQSLMAIPMTLGDYNKYRNWAMPADEDPYTEGYLFQYPDGYESWSPKAQFEKVYAYNGNFNFGHALWLLKHGACVRRAGWNNKGMYLFKVGASENLKANREPLMSILGEGTYFNYQSHIDIFTADGTIVPWVCSQTDMQASDWEIVPDV